MTGCQHCEAEIDQAGNGVWVDGEGMTVCVKAPLTSLPVKPGQPAGFVVHKPMPIAPFPALAACPACGSEDPAEPGHVPGGTGIPLTCGDEWHDQ